MPEFCDCGADKYICQVCHKDLCSQDFQPTWASLSKIGKDISGNVCPECLAEFGKPDETPTVVLVGEDGNAFNIMGQVVKALKKAGATKAYTDMYLDKAMSGDYNHLLGVTMEYVNVE